MPFCSVPFGPELHFKMVTFAVFWQMVRHQEAAGGVQALDDRQSLDEVAMVAMVMLWESRPWMTAAWTRWTRWPWTEVGTHETYFARRTESSMIPGFWLNWGTHDVIGKATG